MANEDTEHGIFKRWSKRKLRSGQAVEDGGPAREDEPDSIADAGAAVPGSEDPAPDAGPEEPVKTDEDMPDLDSIDEATNMSDFFSPGVSEQLRNQALRRLFRMSKFNVVDGLDDYNENFRNFAPLGDLVTSDMRHRLEMDEQRRQEAADAADAGHDEGELADQAPPEDTVREDQEPETVATSSEGPGESAGTDDDETDDNSDPSPRTET